MSILLVDDNPKVLRLLEKSFARLGVTADAVMSFEEAREKLKTVIMTLWRPSSLLKEPRRLISVCPSRP